MVKKTKRKIIDAFSKLVYQRSYDEVTVEMIIKEAGVGKTTFYRYFHDKPDVMFERFKTIYDDAIISSDCKSMEDLFAALLRQAREHPDQYAMFNTSGVNSYLSFIYQYTYEMGKEIVETAWNRKATEIEDFHIAHFCAGGSKILEEWCRGKKYQSMTAEQAAKEMCGSMSDKYYVQLNDAVMHHMKKLIKNRDYYDK